MVLVQPRPPRKTFEKEEPVAKEKDEENTENTGEGAKKTGPSGRGNYRGGGRRDDGYKREPQNRDAPRKKEVFY